MPENTTPQAAARLAFMAIGGGPDVEDFRAAYVGSYAGPRELQDAFYASAEDAGVHSFSACPEVDEVWDVVDRDGLLHAFWK